jgi:hypothetical protein
MNLKQIFSGLAMSVLITASHAFAADFDINKIRDEQCTRKYSQIDNFLQYLYKANGNLKDLNSYKIKRIDYLEGVFADNRTSKAQRSAAFNELYNDPDWWVYKLQKGSKKLIVQLESLKKDSNWDTFKKLATQQAARQITENLYSPSATRSMHATIELIKTSADFFAERTEIKDRLDALGASDRLSRAFSNDPQQDSFESKFYFFLTTELIGCQIDFLASRLNKN